MVRTSLLVVSALLVFVVGCGEAAQPTGRPPLPREIETPVPRTPSLEVGTLLPPLKAGGWLHGPPHTPGEKGQKLLLVDVWAHWCPFCESGAPALVSLHKKYADQGVQFVGITNMPEDMVDAFLRRFSMTWPNGYSASPEMVVALGAGTGMSTPGYQVAPTIYLVGPDGRIVWTDGRAREKHTPRETWEKELDAAIASALKGPAKEPAEEQQGPQKQKQP